MTLDEFVQENTNYDKLSETYEEFLAWKWERPTGDRENSHHFITWCYEIATPIMQDFYSDYITE